MTSVAIIGSGPYGLSLASHLSAAGVDFRIFGKPMANWRERMPAGMFLKSEGFASSLVDPKRTCSLRNFCETQGIPYQDVGLPVSLATFVSYGMHFQRLLVPDLDESEVVRIERSGGSGFVVHPSTGDPISADRVVIATGISHFRYVPPVLEGLTREYLSHSSDPIDASSLKGREVVVIGAGASAFEFAALLHEAGAKVQMVSRRPKISVNPRPAIHRTWLERIRRPDTKLGPGWKNLLCAKLPLAFYFLPRKIRSDMVRCHLGPALGWYLWDKAGGHFPFQMLLGAEPLHATAFDGRVHLQVGLDDGSTRVIECDHIISATGYRVDVRRLPFLSEGMLRDLKSDSNTPRLSLSFESSVPGLYFTGLAAASQFGPVMRFACGAEFSTPRLARHLIRATQTTADEAGQARERHLSGMAP